MNWTIVDFGKFKDKNKTLPQVVFIDPDWFFWAFDAGVFRGALTAEAAFVAERARRIRIPDPEGRELVAEYTVSSKTGKFAVLELVPRDRELHARSMRKWWLDLSSAAGGYDKLGGRNLVRAAKYMLFRGAPLTKARVEAFFNDPSNFDLPPEASERAARR